MSWKSVPDSVPRSASLQTRGTRPLPGQCLGRGALELKEHRDQALMDGNPNTRKKGSLRTTRQFGPGPAPGSGLPLLSPRLPQVRGTCLKSQVSPRPWLLSPQKAHLGRESRRGLLGQPGQSPPQARPPGPAWGDEAARGAQHTVSSAGAGSSSVTWLSCGTRQAGPPPPRRPPSLSLRIGLLAEGSSSCHLPPEGHHHTLCAVTPRPKD